MVSSFLRRHRAVVEHFAPLPEGLFRLSETSARIAVLPPDPRKRLAKLYPFVTSGAKRPAIKKAPTSTRLKLWLDSYRENMRENKRGRRKGEKRKEPPAAKRAIFRWPAIRRSTLLKSMYPRSTSVRL